MNHERIRVDCLFPGGNILVNSINGSHIRLHQDLRTTTIDWFYWAFQVSGCAGQTLEITFTQSDVIGVLGPAYSLDGGLTWNWLGREGFKGQSFTFSVPQEVQKVRFSLGMSYQQANLSQFLASHCNSPAIKSKIFCYTRKGRPVKVIYAGRMDSKAPVHILLTARHHACEMMASYSLEGILETVLSESETGHWLRQNAAFLVVPFMDTDGVEDGDQGKNRWPWDPNRDYAGESIYPEVRTVRQVVPAWCNDRLDVSIDLHCPWIRGPGNEFIFFVGGPEENLWNEVVKISQILEQNRKGPIPYEARNNLPFGTEWNTGSETGRKSNSEWIAETFPSIRLGTSIEIPYANASGVEVNPTSARVFGHDLGEALYCYLK